MLSACQSKKSIKSESCYKSFCASLSVTYPKELKVLKRSNTLKLRYWCMNCGPNISNMGKWVKRTILWSLLGQLLDPKFLLLQLTGQAMSGNWTVSLLLLVVVVELIKNLKALICSSFLFCKVFLCFLFEISFSKPTRLLVIPHWTTFPKSTIATHTVNILPQCCRLQRWRPSGSRAQSPHQSDDLQHQLRPQRPQAQKDQKQQWSRLLSLLLQCCYPHQQHLQRWPQCWVQTGHGHPSGGWNKE